MMMNRSSLLILLSTTTFIGAAAAAAASFSVGGTFLTDQQKAELDATAAAIATAGKGITACDEGPGTIGTRFQKVGIENTEENRRCYRQMLFETKDCENYLSAAILDPETLYQKSSSKTNNNKYFPEVLMERGIIPGIKPHLKIYTLPGTNGDTVMQGLDSLGNRCHEYYKAGARFAKWRSPLIIDMKYACPTNLAIQANMNDLARYALICQSEGLMPIVEPDISLQGSHTLEEAVDINIRVQSTLYKAMIDHGVYMSGTTLKPNIVNPGRDCSISYSVEEIAAANVFVLEQALPVSMRGVNYLSGGQTLQQGAARLSAINKANTKGPWNLSFSWSQALQLPLLDLCMNKNNNDNKNELQLEQMSELYIKELKIASLASKGEYEWVHGEGDHVGIGGGDDGGVAADAKKKKKKKKKQEEEKKVKDTVLQPQGII